MVRQKNTLCNDFGLPESYCKDGVFRASACKEDDVLKRLLLAAEEPQSLLNVKGRNVFWNSFLESELAPMRYADINAFGEAPGFGYGTGGLMLPKLQNKTLEKLVATEEFQVNHLQH